MDSGQRIGLWGHWDLLYTDTSSFPEWAPMSVLSSLKTICENEMGNLGEIQDNSNNTTPNSELLPELFESRESCCCFLPELSI